MRVEEKVASPSATTGRMHERTVRLLAWGSLAMVVALNLSSFAIAIDGSAGQGGQEAIQFSIGGAALIFLFVLSFSIVGAIIATKRPDNGLGWLFCADGLLISLQILAGSYTERGLSSVPGSLPGAEWFALLSDALWVPFVFMTTALLFLLFPEGHPASAGRKRAFRIAWVVVVIGTLLGFLEPTLYSYPDVSNPIGVRLPDAVYGGGGTGGFLVLLGVLSYAVVDLFRRLRRSTGEERLQFRWFGYSTALILILFIPVAVLEATPAFLQLAGGLAIFTLPLSVGIAILKYRLYEIDVVIRKTIVFGILVAILLALGAVVAIVFASIASEPLLSNRLNVGMAGLAIGLLAAPLYRVAKRIADRMVFGGRRTPYEILTEFSNRVGDTYSSEDVLPRMAQLVTEATGATGSGVWLRLGNEFRPAATWPVGTHAIDPVAVGDEPLSGFVQAAFEVRHQGELLGALTVEMPSNDPMTPAKERIVRDVAAQAGLVLRNVRLIEELRASRQRLVTAQDEERRRLERNIHDGAQQQLVALAVKERLAGSLVGKDDERLRAMLGELQAETTEALDDLRDLASGIYPPLLADKGLAAALGAQARRSVVPVTVDADSARFPREVESAVYFSCLEALQNVAKYAHASLASIRISTGQHELRFEVSDDGVGFDTTQISYGTGLQGIADRVAALGGQLDVTSGPGGGTTLTGRLPA